LARAQGCLRKLPDGDPQRAPMETIERHAKRCADIVRAMLDFTSESAGPRAPTAVEPLLGRVEELSRAAAHGRDVTIAVTPIADGTPSVSVRGTEIESALLNLVSNAIDASPRGGVVRLGATARAYLSRPGVAISVIDDGPGIPPDVLPRIFDPFFTTKPPGRGRGLGLSLAMQIAEAHGGHLHADTRVGEGTTMWLWLPASVPVRGAT